MRVLIYTSYDGTGYCGWQKQDNGVSVEEKLNDAISDLFKTKIEVIGASRTDAGVHAEGAAAVFDCETRMPAEKICYALNQRLPEDIRVIRSEMVDDEFHPRHCDSEKTYEYRIWNSRFENPLNRLYTDHVHVFLDSDKMKEAAEYLVGEHDYTSFASTKAEVESFVRTIYSITVDSVGESTDRSDLNMYGSLPDADGSVPDVYEKLTDRQGLDRKDFSYGKEIRIRVTGNGFLYNMVRIIAGTLIEVGRGAIDPIDVKRILEARDRNQAGPTAPAKGLTMKGIIFK
jgi:tRNA pseudouridine38-40 synthase